MSSSSTHQRHAQKRRKLYSDRTLDRSNSNSVTSAPLEKCQRDTSSSRDSFQNGVDEKIVTPAATLTTVSDITAVEDIFYNILSFFVQNSASSKSLDDVQSFRSIMCVSRQWYDLSTSSSFWLTLSQKAANSDNTSCLSSLWPSIGDVRVTLDHALIGFRKIRSIGSMSKSCGCCVADLREPVIDGSQYMRSYRRCNNDKVVNRCYKVQERSTKKQYILKISNKFCALDGTYSPGHLTELVACQRLTSNDSVRDHFNTNQRPANTRHHYQNDNFSLLYDWKQLSRKNLLHLYEDNDNMISLDAYMKASSQHRCEELCRGKWSLFKSILYQVLCCVIEMHQSGIIHRDLHCNNIFVESIDGTAGDGRDVASMSSHIDCNNRSAGNQSTSTYNHHIRSAEVTVKIGDFSKCRCFSALDLIGLERKNQYKIFYDLEDFHSIGQIFLSMLTDMMEAKKPGNGLMMRDEFCILYQNDMFDDDVECLFEEDDNDCDLVQLAAISTLAMSSPHNNNDESPHNNNDEDCKMFTQALDLVRRLLCLSIDNYTDVFTLASHPFFEGINSSPTNIVRKIREGKCLDAERTEQLRMLRMVESSSVRPLDEHKIHVTFDEWAKIVDWLLEIVSVFDKSTRTVFMAMGYMDKVINKSETVKRNKLQLIAATCLYIASKVGDHEWIDVTNLYYSADRTFQKKDILKLEVQILKQLDWCLVLPTIHDAVELYYAYLKDVGSTCFWISQYLCEVALQSSLHLKRPPSLVAASIIALSRHWTGMVPFPVELQTFSGYSFSELGDCIICLASFLNENNPNLRIIHNRYMKSYRRSVARLHLPIPDLEMMK